MKKFVFTCGDINGIGPEISIKALNKLTSLRRNIQFILIIPENVFHKTSKLVKPKFKFQIVDEIKSNSSTSVLIHRLNSVEQNIGKPTILSGKSSYHALKLAFKYVINNYADAIVTAPVSKTALHCAGVKYPGQTEMFADWCGVKNFVMTFISKKLNVGLYSIHIPLKDVSKSLSTKEYSQKLKILNSMLKDDIGLKNPRTAVLGLNPHAGENGIIGKEEQKILIPVLKNKKLGGTVDGPFSPDAFFANREFKKYDMVFGLYHDQVLIPFKYINARKGVNFTAGLPIVRTSPDHGVAFDIAGKGIADESSMIEAFKTAEIILKNRNSSKLK